MKRKYSILKIAVLTLFLSLVFGCRNNSHEKGFRVRIHSQSNSLGAYTIQCDSFNMKSQTEIDIWVNGRKSTVINSEIIPYSTCY